MIELSVSASSHVLNRDCVRTAPCDPVTKILNAVRLSEAEYNDCFEGALIFGGRLSNANVADLQLRSFTSLARKGIRASEQEFGSDRFTMMVGRTLMPVMDEIITGQLAEMEAEWAAKYGTPGKIDADIRLNSADLVATG